MERLTIVVIAAAFLAGLLLGMHAAGETPKPMIHCTECGDSVIEGASAIHETCVDHMLEEAYEPAAPDEEKAG